MNGCMCGCVWVRASAVNVHAMGRLGRSYIRVAVYLLSRDCTGVGFDLSVLSSLLCVVCFLLLLCFRFDVCVLFSFPELVGFSFFSITPTHIHTGKKKSGLFCGGVLAFSGNQSQLHGFYSSVMESLSIWKATSLVCMGMILSHTLAFT